MLNTPEIPFENLLPQDRADFYRVIREQLMSEPIFDRGLPINAWTVAMGSSIKDQLVAPLPNGSTITVIDEGPFLVENVATDDLEDISRKFDLIKKEAHLLGFEATQPVQVTASPNIYTSVLHGQGEQCVNIRFVEALTKDFVKSDNPIVLQLQDERIDFINLKATDTALLNFGICQLLLQSLNDNGVIIADERSLQIYYEFAYTARRTFDLVPIQLNPMLQEYLAGGHHWGYKKERETTNLLLLRKHLI